MLEQHITKNGQVDKNTLQLEFENNDKGEKYEVEVICESAIYIMKSESGTFLGMYYLITWKSFQEEENILESASVIQHHQRLISTFNKKNPDKPTTNSTPIDITLLTARYIVKARAQNNKRKRGQPAKANSIRKRFKKN